MAIQLEDDRTCEVPLPIQCVYLRNGMIVQQLLCDHEEASHGRRCLWHVSTTWSYEERTKRDGQRVVTGSCHLHPFRGNVLLLIPLVPIEKSAHQYRVGFRRDMLPMDVYGEDIYNRLGGNYTCEKTEKSRCWFLIKFIYILVDQQAVFPPCTCSP